MIEVLLTHFTLWFDLPLNSRMNRTLKSFTEVCFKSPTRAALGGILNLIVEKDVFSRYSKSCFSIPPLRIYLVVSRVVVVKTGNSFPLN